MAQRPRLDLQELLLEILDSDYVYFQPPANLKMIYPCIVYEREEITTDRANNKAYQLHNRYLVTVIDRDPDSEIPDKIIASFPMCVFDRAFRVDNLNHTTFKLFF